MYPFVLSNRLFTYNVVFFRVRICNLSPTRVEKKSEIPSSLHQQQTPSICKFLMKNELLNESLLSIELINEGHIALETGFALKSG